MIGIPIVLLIYFIPYNLILGIFSNVTGGAFLFILRILSMFFAMIPAIGDPLIRILLNYYPNIIAVDNLNNERVATLKEFNLSEKRKAYGYGYWVYRQNDVKEFIKRLKEYQYYSEVDTWEEFIDKLAGKDLI